MRHLHHETSKWSIAAFAAALVGLAATGPLAQAQVTPGSSFSIAVAGFTNITGTETGSFLTAAVTATFGTTQMFSGDALGGQVLTVSSSESIVGTNVVDSFSISVPNGFAPSGTTVGSPAGPVQAEEADIGGYNAGPTPIQFVFPEPSLATTGVTGQMIYSGGNFALSPQGNTQLTNSNMSLATAEGVNAGGSDLSAFGIKEFDFTLTYPVAPVPEPGSMALCGLAVAGISAWRRRRAA